MRQIETNRDRRVAAAKSPIRSHDRRERRDRVHRLVERTPVAAEADERGGHPQGVHRRRLRRGRLAKHCCGGAGQRPAPREIAGEPIALGGRRQTPVQEQIRYVFERGARRKIFDGVSGKREPARLAVDVAQSRRRSDDAFETVRHSMIVGPASSVVNIDRRINPL